MNTSLRFAALTLAVGISGTAHAALQGRDLNGSLGSFEAYYDTVLDITWLADANAGAGSSYDNGSNTTDGRMTWANANAWAANLSFYNPLTNQTYADWRLPTVEPVNGVSFNYGFSKNGSTDVGYNMSEQGTAYAGSTGSEMAHLNSLGPRTTWRSDQAALREGGSGQLRGRQHGFQGMPVRDSGCECALEG